MGCGTSSFHHEGARKRAGKLVDAGFKRCVQNRVACACASSLKDMPKTVGTAQKGIICSHYGTDPVTPREVRDCTRFKPHSSG
jgi:hypothetical protein